LTERVYLSRMHFIYYKERPAALRWLQKKAR